jgi:hypothetical protein
MSITCRTKRIVNTPQGYDITKPEKTELGNKLREISGIAWVNENTMLAENDEAGKIFTINLDDKNNLSYPSIVFGPKDDYEDIVIKDTLAYLLISDGEIAEVSNYSKGGDVQGTVVASLGGDKNELESLYYDKDINSLIMLCKSCHHEKNRIRSAYRFDLAARKLSDTPYFNIDIGEIRKILGDDGAEFYPSAAAIHPLQHKLYIVSSTGKLLVITDTMGKVENVFRLSPSLFPQPEGITFAPDGDMYISNEGKDDKATLLKFTYTNH